MSDPLFWSFQTYQKLGDALCVMYMLENLGRTTGKQSVIVDNKICKQLCNLFHIEHVTCQSDSKSPAVKLGAAHNHYIRQRHFICSALAYMKRKLNFDPKSCKPLTPKQTFHEKEKITLVQLDGRTNAMHGVLMPTQHMRHVIKRLTNNPVALIGGNDTEKYLGDFYEYRLGNLDYLLKEMQTCDSFIGSDSGMSHLAGILGIESHVILLHPSVCLSTVYNMYHNTHKYCLSSSKCTHDRTKLKDTHLRFI